MPHIILCNFVSHFQLIVVNIHLPIQINGYFINFMVFCIKNIDRSPDAWRWMTSRDAAILTSGSDILLPFPFSLAFEHKLQNSQLNTSCSIHRSADTFQYLQIIYTSTVCLPLLISALISLSSYNCLFFLFLSFHNYSSHRHSSVDSAVCCIMSVWSMLCLIIQCVPTFNVWCVLFTIVL